MDKIIGEEDLKGLEEEIDDAIDRLFVDKKEGITDNFLMESSLLEPSLKSPMEKRSTEFPILEPLIKPSLLEPSDEVDKKFEQESPLLPTSPPIPYLKSIEKMEAQLLSLEWEITGEKIKKTREEVLALRELLKQKADMTSILNYMEKSLNHMIRNEENIQPSWIKFLLDSKETLKLLMRKETGGEINIYKQLAYLGIEARFSCLQGMIDTPISSPSLDISEERDKVPAPSLTLSEEREKVETPIAEWKRIGETLSKMNSFSEKMDESLGKMEPYLSKIEQLCLKFSETLVEARPLPVSITIFKVEDRLFGVESEKVFKLFKVPNTFQEKYSNQQKIRLRGFEVKMINLEEILSIPGGEPRGEIKILMVKDNGEYKGFIVDQVLKKLSAPSDKEGKMGEYFSGIIHSTFQEQAIEIPILDLKKL
jgi:hypothetical protein